MMVHPLKLRGKIAGAVEFGFLFFFIRLKCNVTVGKWIDKGEKEVRFYAMIS